MKTSILLNVLLALATVMFCLSVVPTYGQNDPSKEIMVYFTTGVERSQENQPARISSLPIINVLAHFKINQDKVTSAFPKFNEADTLKQTPDGRLIRLPNMAKIFKVQVPEGIKREAVIDSLKKIPGVLFAEPNGTVEPHVVPNDQYFSYQWSLQAGGGTGKIQAPEAWDIYSGNSNNIIGIVDGGIDGTHPDLNGKVSGDGGYGWTGHGIHVGGIASAKTNNWDGSKYVGIAGVDWNAQLHAQRVDNVSDDAGIYQAVVDAVNYSTNVRVLNNSWGLTPAGRYSTTVRMAFAYAYKMNRAAVVSMGNNNGSQTQYPAGFGHGIIAVGATNSIDEVPGFSNTGNHIDVSAPGVDILSTYRNGYNFYNQQGILDANYQYLSGTSMAAPHVSGIASLLKGYNPNLYNDDIEQIIRLGVDDKGDPGFDNSYGTGRVNAYKALKLISSPNEIVRLGTYTGGTVASVGNTTTARLYGVPGISDGTYSVTRYEVVRDIQFPQYMSPPSVPGISFDLPQAWGNGTATTPSVSGLPYYNGNCAACCIGDVDIFGLPHTEVVPGSVTNTGAQLRTYVYRVRTLYYISGVCVPYTDLGYFPTSPDNVQFAATVVGRSGIQKSNQLMEISIPKVFSFEQNYPNPFNPSTTISYSLPADGHVQIKVYDLLGREVAELFNGTETAGYHNIVFDAGNLSSGTYIVNMNVNSSEGKTFNRSRKILLMK